MLSPFSRKKRRRKETTCLLICKTRLIDWPLKCQTQKQTTFLNILFYFSEKIRPDNSCESTESLEMSSHIFCEKWKKIFFFFFFENVVCSNFELDFNGYIYSHGHREAFRKLILLLFFHQSPYLEDIHKWSHFGYSAEYPEDRFWHKKWKTYHLNLRIIGSYRFILMLTNYLL